MKFYSNPFNTDATGFYFETYEEFLEKSAALPDGFDSTVEEFEIDVMEDYIVLLNCIQLVLLSAFLFLH